MSWVGSGTYFGTDQWYLEPKREAYNIPLRKGSLNVLKHTGLDEVNQC